MLMLIATGELPDSGPSDHHLAVDGELVAPVVLECPDTLCDVCPRAWFGLVSRAGTTTAMIVDRPDLTEVLLRDRIHEWLKSCGSIDLVVEASEAGEYEVAGVRITDPLVAVDELVSAHVDEIRAICAEFPVGTVVSRFGQLVAPRAVDSHR